MRMVLVVVLVDYLMTYLLIILLTILKKKLSVDRCNEKRERAKDAVSNVNNLKNKQFMATENKDDIIIAMLEAMKSGMKN